MFIGSWLEFKGGDAGVEQVAMIEDSELAVGIGELVEGSNRAMSVLCRKGDSDNSVCCSCVSGLDSAEDVGDGGGSWGTAGSSFASAGFSVSEMTSNVLVAFVSCMALLLLSSSHMSHFHCSRCVRP